MPLEPAVGNRAWMDATDERFAYRCLPLKVANESGWVFRSFHLVLARWDGGSAKWTCRSPLLLVGVVGQCP
jgi:hypothetical protein